MKNRLLRKYITINGTVQGVGFRPFVYKTAVANNLSGYVANYPGGVQIDVEGIEEDINKFLYIILDKVPPLAQISEYFIEDKPLSGYISFSIRESSYEEGTGIFISPDIGICDDCIREMADSANRRYLYPFINCTNCGPRFTITSALPYDRENTTMDCFTMCPSCDREYHDSIDRRFHAQPVSCHDCGPELALLDSAGKKVCCTNEIEKTAELIKKGNIIAIKGLGGYHIVCNARSINSLKELRKRKHRDGKPFALMAKDLDTVYKYCIVTNKEKELLNSIRKPIVILQRKKDINLPLDEISMDTNTLGIMLPYTPLNHLLFKDNELELLVFTSGNISGEPIYYRDYDAIRGLINIADYFLTNNRDIYVRTDDSVTSIFNDKEYILRRSRGYVPSPVILSKNLPKSEEKILATGGELKNTFCLLSGNNAFLSHHIGDLESLETLTSFEQGIEHFKNILSLEPQIIAFDMHPEYMSTKYALSSGISKKVVIQHHHAHIASCMAENSLSGQVIGIAFDGTGYGEDGTIWGGEFFTCDLLQFNREAHFEYIPMPGGNACIKEPWRMGLSYLLHSVGDNYIKTDLYRRLEQGKSEFLKMQIQKHVNTPMTSSSGRLFDAVSSVCGLCDIAQYEAQGALRLEKAADINSGRLYPYCINEIQGKPLSISFKNLIEAIVSDLSANRPVSEIAGAFHCTISALCVDVCKRLRKKYNIDDVVLSGGVFQNRLVLGLLTDSLINCGFKVYTHSLVPTNDGGLSLGQAVIAAAKHSAV